MRRFIFALISSIAGYIIGLLGGMVAINVLSSNQHDRSVEAAMTSALICGPAVGIVTFIAVLVLLPRRRSN